MGHTVLLMKNIFLPMKKLKDFARFIFVDWTKHTKLNSAKKKNFPQKFLPLRLCWHCIPEFNFRSLGGKNIEPPFLITFQFEALTVLLPNMQRCFHVLYITQDVRTTLLQRYFNVSASFQRPMNVVPTCAGWDGS